MGSIARLCEICRTSGEGGSIIFCTTGPKPKVKLPSDALANAKLGWFCKQHLSIALKYKDLPKPEALEKILKEIHK